MKEPKKVEFEILALALAVGFFGNVAATYLMNRWQSTEPYVPGSSTYELLGWVGVVGFFVLTLLCFCLAKRKK